MSDTSDMVDRRFSFHTYDRSGILQIIDDWDLIDFDPDYQRKGGVWDLEKKQYFIDSIINGMDLTKLYFHELSPAKRLSDTATYGVIDGKQRLEAIQGFVQNRFPLSDEFEYLHGDGDGGEAGGKRYADLLMEFPVLRARFDDTVLPVTVMRAKDEVLIEGLFVRLNEQANLNAAEKRNAFGGPIPLIIRELAKHSLFTDYVPFDDGRYRHRDLAAKFLWIIHQGRFVSTKRRDLDDFVKAYRTGDEWPTHPEALLRDAQAVADDMCRFFTPRDGLLRSVGWITLYFHLFRLRRNSTPRARLRRGHFVRFVDKVTATRHWVRDMADGKVLTIDVEIDPDLTQFDSLRQSPNDATALRTRYAILRRHFSSIIGITLPEMIDT